MKILSSRENMKSSLINDDADRDDNNEDTQIIARTPKFKSRNAKHEVQMTSVDTQGSGVYPLTKGIKPARAKAFNDKMTIA